MKRANLFIALLRGVNVVGANSLRMNDLVRLLQRLGLRQVKTYIQSGNAVFQAKEAKADVLSRKIKDGIRRAHGFAPEVIVLRLEDLEGAIAANPYPGADADPKALHLAFLAAAPAVPDWTAFKALQQENEQYALEGRVFYFYAPDGVGRSKLFSRLEKLLGVTVTARNWRTAGKILEMAREVAATEEEHA